MNVVWIIAVFSVVDDLMTRLGPQSHVFVQVPDSEILTVAIVSAKFFQNHHERAIYILKTTGYMAGSFSLSHFNRDLHALVDWLPFAADALGELAARRRQSDFIRGQNKNRPLGRFRYSFSEDLLFHLRSSERPGKVFGSMLRLTYAFGLVFQFAIFKQFFPWNAPRAASRLAFWLE